WLKPPSVPPEPAPDDDQVLHEEMSPPAAPGAAPSGQATGAAGGYGSASDRASSGGSAEGTESTSDAGDDDQTNWLRNARGGSDDPGEAAEEGLTYVPPVDPPVVMGEGGMPQVAAGFGTTADDEPFDADHHDAALYDEDERSERVREALLSHAATSGLVDRL